MRHNFRAGAAALSAVVVLLSGCDTGTTTGTNGQPFEMSAQVSVQGFAFRQDNVSVAVGGEVTWTNEDAPPHPLRFEDGRTFSLAGGDSVTVSFDEPGVFAYRCAVHQGMRGTVTVGASDTGANSTPRGGY